MDISGGDKNRVFLHDLIKITEGTVSQGTIFMLLHRQPVLVTISTFTMLAVYGFHLENSFWKQLYYIKNLQFVS